MDGGPLGALLPFLGQSTSARFCRIRQGWAIRGVCTLGSAGAATIRTIRGTKGDGVVESALATRQRRSTPEIRSPIFSFIGNFPLVTRN